MSRLEIVTIALLSTVLVGGLIVAGVLFLLGTWKTPPFRTQLRAALWLLGATVVLAVVRTIVLGIG